MYIVHGTFQRLIPIPDSILPALLAFCNRYLVRRCLIESSSGLRQLVGSNEANHMQFYPLRLQKGIM